MVVGQLFTALTSLVLMASADADTTRALTHWLLGSMAPARWDAVVVSAIVMPVGLAAAWLCAGALDGLAFGADTAASLGIGVRRTRMLLLVVTAVLTSVAVATVGAIGFVGLIVPHGVRFLVGPLHRVLLPCAALMRRGVPGVDRRPGAGRLRPAGGAGRRDHRAARRTAVPPRPAQEG